MSERARAGDPEAIAEIEEYKRTFGSPMCEAIGCLGVDEHGEVEGINCLTYQTETGTRVVWLCDSHRATATDEEGTPLDIEVVDGGEWKPKV